MSRLLSTFALVLLLILPIGLLILPYDYFDNKTSYCISSILYQRSCPGCGITRAIQHALHLDFSGAWHYNPLYVIILPILIYLYFLLIGHFISKIKKHI